MLAPETFEIADATLPAMGESVKAIARRFFVLILAAYPEFQSYFNPAHRRSGSQKRALSVLSLALEPTQVNDNAAKRKPCCPHARFNPFRRAFP
jgi:hemoglobin-like flavoprotein